MSRCGRTLICGHVCPHPLHPTSPCPPCVQPCLRSCPHLVCSLPCSEPCSPCTEPCSRHCPHRAPCTRVCAAPCDAFPCPNRCEKLLACGHRCPAVCAEPCPDVKYCCICADHQIKDQVVDMLGFVIYAHLSNLDDDPIIVLPCAHFFCRSTMDGIMDLSDSGFVPFERSFVTPRQCPTCKAPIHGINRYAYVQNVADLRLLERKHQTHTLHQFQDRLVAIAEKKKSVANRKRNLLVYLCGTNFGEAKREALELDLMLNSLKNVLKCVGSGPMTMVNETLPVPERLRNAEQRIDMYQSDVLLQMGRACIPQIRVAAKNDIVYLVARSALKAAIMITDLNGSHRSGAEARLLLVEAFLTDDRVRKYYRSFDKSLWRKRLEANHLCKWVIEHRSPGVGKSLKDDARFLMARIALHERMEVKRTAEKWGSRCSPYVAWNRCPNGHEYAIGDCGTPSETGRCPECGAVIGRNAHRSVSNNR